MHKRQTKVTPELTPNSIMATDTANSKKLLAPMNTVGVASAKGIRIFFVQNTNQAIK